MMTTKSVGMDTDVANPKPVRHVNWTGQPMKEGDSYWGESEPQEAKVEQVQTVARPRKAKRNQSAWTPERRAEYGAKMKAWWQAKRNSAPEV
jgi:hypothetical protein